MTKMAAMPIYGTNPSKIFFFRTDASIWLRDVSRKNQFLPGRFAQKIFFERDVSSRDGSRIFSKNDFKVLVIKINQVNAMCMLN